MNRNRARGIALLAAVLVPVGQACAQTTSSPFATGASALQSSFLTILTPIAVIAVMALGVAAWFNRISWNWAAGGAIGILLVFGAPQVVTWVRGLAGV